MNPYILISSKKIYENPWMTVTEDSVETDGKRWLFWVVTFKIGTAIVVIDEDDNIILNQEYKYALRCSSINLPGGSLDDSETPLEWAKREMEEEIGYIAQEWISLWVIHPLTTNVRQTEHIFLARKLTKTKQKLDSWEQIDILKIPFKKALEMVENSEITHGASALGILKAQKYIL